MQRFRAYVLGDDQSIELVVDLYSSDEASALLLAAQLLEDGDVEVWESDRLVKRLTLPSRRYSASYGRQHHARHVDAEQAQARDACG